MMISSAYFKTEGFIMGCYRLESLRALRVEEIPVISVKLRRISGGYSRLCFERTLCNVFLLDSSLAISAFFPEYHFLLAYI